MKCSLLDAMITKDPNPLSLHRERVKRPVLETYRAKRRQFFLYQAAAKLWSEGVAWQRALDIVTEAFVATTHE